MPIVENHAICGTKVLLVTKYCFKQLSGEIVIYATEWNTIRDNVDNEPKLISPKTVEGLTR